MMDLPLNQSFSFDFNEFCLLTTGLMIPLHACMYCVYNYVAFPFPDLWDECVASFDIRHHPSICWSSIEFSHRILTKFRRVQKKSWNCLWEGNLFYSSIIQHSFSVVAQPLFWRCQFKNLRLKIFQWSYVAPQQSANNPKLSIQVITVLS